MRSFESFRDIIEPRRKEWSTLAWSTRDWNPIVAFRRSNRVHSETLKQNVLTGTRLDTIIEQISNEEKTSPKEVKKKIKLMLDEIGFAKDLKVIRALSIVLVKMISRTVSGLYVNWESYEKLISKMGTNPVLFVPSHRSYADFILMSYVCFTLNLEIPAIAAGMDFHGMKGMGTVLRHTGAFFMRRQFANDRLYSTVFAEYVRQLIVNGDIPIEFFIEGTRSRSCKSLSPKYGFLSMALKPFLFGEVPDVTIVPISISYDRVMEEKLFAVEILGVPKPKESTSGFFKSLNILNENFGEIYFDFSEPISARDYFGLNINRADHSLGAVSAQTLNNKETEQLCKLAYHIIHVQQSHCVLTVFNLIAIILNNNIILGRSAVSYLDLEKDILWLKSIFELFEAIFHIEDIKKCIDNAFVVHKNLIVRTKDDLIKLLTQIIVLGNYDKSKLKGYALSEETMSSALPLVELQLYINPCLHYIIGAAVVIVNMNHLQKNHAIITKNELWNSYKYLRRLLAAEFVISQDRENEEFEQAMDKLCKLSIIKIESNGGITMDAEHRLVELLYNILLPFLTTYKTVCEIFLENGREYSEKQILVETQKRVEELLYKNTHFVHPYSLSLDTISISLTNLNCVRGLTKFKRNNTILFKPNISELAHIVDKLANLLSFHRTLPSDITAISIKHSALQTFSKI